MSAQMGSFVTLVNPLIVSAKDLPIYFARWVEKLPRGFCSSRAGVVPNEPTRLLLHDVLATFFETNMCHGELQAGLVFIARLHVKRVWSEMKRLVK